MTTNNDQILEAQGRKERRIRVLFLESNFREAKTIYPLAERFTEDNKGRLIILSVLSIPQGEQLSEVATKASQLRQEFTTYLTREPPSTTRIRTLVRSEKEIWDGIRELVLREKVDVLFAHWNAMSLAGEISGAIENSPLFNLPCAVVIVRPSAAVTKTGQLDSIQSILLPVRGGVNAALLLRISDGLARLADATITLLHVTTPETREDKIRFLEEYSPALYGLEPVTRSLTVKGELPAAITKETFEHEVIVMGVPGERARSTAWWNSFLDNLLSDESKTIVIGTQVQPSIDASAAPEDHGKILERPLAVVVDKWFAENTYHSQEFADLERLMAFKREQGITISLGLPALNEEETVGTVIQEIQEALMEKVHLLDEIILIDSGSVDRTQEIAHQFGIQVVRHQEILRQHGSYSGKGEALWKSLYVLSGDLIAWIDTDIKNIDPRFVYGILGPLLVSPRIQYVKGFYRRPLRDGDILVAGGGGRVTELTARPLINLFYPELSGLIQPLSGEYAGRRTALERLPFFTGYSVETGLLIDLLREYGLEGIAQVDLLERIHHNQPLPSLSKMSFSILQVVISRLEERHAVHLLEPANLTVNLIRHGQRRGYFLEQEEILEVERPPMITIPEYRQKRGLPAQDENPAGSFNHVSETVATGKF
jgi:glucosyl-3-phosphoglycerate synthase